MLDENNYIKQMNRIIDIDLKLNCKSCGIYSA